MRVFISQWLKKLYATIGMDTPANHEDIVSFIEEHIKESANLDKWNSDDIVIGFRRFLESHD